MSEKDVTPFPFPAKVHEQIRRVRESGRVNMLDITGVQYEANKLDCHDLVIFIHDLTELPRTERGRRWMETLNAAMDDSE